MPQVEDTPLMRQWREVKSRHQDALVFFRVGDFYELFYGDAEEGSRLLGLTLFLVGLRFKRARILNITGRMLRVLPRKIASLIHAFISSFADGLALFQSPKSILWAVFYSAVTWFFILVLGSYLKQPRLAARGSPLRDR